MIEKTTKEELIESFVKLARTKNFLPLLTPNGLILEAERRIKRFKANVRAARKKRPTPNSSIVAGTLRWTYAEPGRARMVFNDETYVYDLEAQIMLIGELHFKDGQAIKVVKKFVSHPFYQHATIPFGDSKRLQPKK
jgi:hypothetical protein